MTQAKKVANISQLPPGETILVEIDNKDLLIVNVGGEIFAITNDCTHSGGSLCEDFLDEDIIECPLHGAKFNVRSGEVVEGPADEPISTYEVTIDGQDILVFPA